MPGFNVDGGNGNQNQTNGNYMPSKESNAHKFQSPMRQHSSPGSPQSYFTDMAIDGVIDTSIDQLYTNICEMQSSDHSPTASFLSYGEESRIDSELCHLVGTPFEVKHEVDLESCKTLMPVDQDKISTTRSSMTKSISSLQFKKLFRSKTSAKSSPSRKSSHDKPRTGKTSGNPVKRQKDLVSVLTKLQNGTDEVFNDAELDNPDMGPFLLKQVRDLVSSGENSQKVLGLALRARTSFERSANDKKPNLELVMCLHFLAAIYINLRQFDDAIPVLERSIEIPSMEEGENHALAKFAGCMQLGDTYALMGHIENAILFYTAGLEIQRQVLGENDLRVGETCRYVSEAYVQLLQFNEAERLCQMAFEIHRQNGSPASLEEAADRCLMGLICNSKGDHEAALEHYVLAGMAVAANGQQAKVAAIDCSIGDTYLSLSRYDEAVFAYQKALISLKLTKGENHPTVASVYVRLADLNNRIGKFRDSKSYCGNALRIYGKTNHGVPLQEIANGLVDVSAIFESMNEFERALKLLQKALKIYGDSPGQQSTVAGIEAQIGVLNYMMGNYNASYNSLKDGILKLRATGEKKSGLFGIALNQMGLACVQRFEINEAVELFEEARSILENEYGPYHIDTLGVYSNLAGTYDALGRLNEAIEILEHVVGMREEKLGTANPDVEDEKRRLDQLLKEAGKVRSRKSRPLETLLDANPTSHISPTTRR